MPSTSFITAERETRKLSNCEERKKVTPHLTMSSAILNAGAPCFLSFLDLVTRVELCCKNHTRTKLSLYNSLLDSALIYNSTLTAKWHPRPCTPSTRLRSHPPHTSTTTKAKDSTREQDPAKKVTMAQLRWLQWPLPVLPGRRRQSSRLISGCSSSVGRCRLELVDDPPHSIC